MATLGRTDQTQWPRAARPAYHQNAVAVNNVAASKAVTLFFQRVPFPITIQSLQDLQFIGVRQFDGRKQGRHGPDHHSIQGFLAISGTVNPSIGKNLISESSTGGGIGRAAESGRTRPLVWFKKAHPTRAIS